jgi:hypothetical protein
MSEILLVFLTNSTAEAKIYLANPYYCKSHAPTDGDIRGRVRGVWAGARAAERKNKQDMEPVKRPLSTLSRWSRTTLGGYATASLE